MATLGWLVALLLVAGCGGDSAPQGDGGVGSDGAVSGSDGLWRGDGRVADGCVAAQPAPHCDVEFRYPAGDEKQVELHGSFDGWTTGVPMTRVGGDWRASLKLDHGEKVLYKFVVDDTTWLADPNNPRRTDDEWANSILDVECPSQCGGSSGGDGGDGSSGGLRLARWRDVLHPHRPLRRRRCLQQQAEPGVETAANFQGGDLAGVLQKLKAGYFDQLGVNVLWLSSPVDAPDGKYIGTDGHMYTGYHGYWPTELDKVEERIGDLALLKQVVAEARARGIRVVLDYVMNHVDIRRAALYTKRTRAGSGRPTWTARTAPSAGGMVQL